MRMSNLIRQTMPPGGESVRFSARFPADTAAGLAAWAAAHHLTLNAAVNLAVAELTARPGPQKADGHD